ncbi:hypothetical protein [Phaeobacter sp.]|uniref:hypothetical protein n=1 Tax=Phaeobacter sp. TaxID=1902409 RepID=UPI0025F133D7|nr:hypothetical protein [Phaeobacter sp.]
MRLIAFLTALISLPVASAAQTTAPPDNVNWSLRDSDAPYSADALSGLPGQAFVFFDDGEARFGSDGAYSYTYSAVNGGGTAWGTYHIAADGSVCVTFVNGASRCDLFVVSGGRTVVITETGERFPVR